MSKEKNKRIQRALRGLGLYWASIDGDYGPKTKKAVKDFQRINPPLKVDGVAGKNTLEALFPKTVPGRDQDAGSIILRKQGKWPRQREMREFYGLVGRNQTKIILPYPMLIAWDKSKTITRFSCHKLVKEPMQAIFEESLEEYGSDGIIELGLNLFGGCLNVRKMRGGTKYSTHAWGAALDLDPEHNQFKWNHKKARFARPEYVPFWKIVEKHGGVSLGRKRDMDWMHVQWARL